MHISFKVKNSSYIARLFCRYIIRWLRVELMRDTDFESVQIRLNKLSDASWMGYRSNPKNIAAKQFIRLVCDALTVVQYRNAFIITLDNHKLFPNSFTPLSTVAKFVDIGNEEIRGSYFMKRLELKYNSNIYDYWAAFKIRTQR